MTPRGPFLRHQNIVLIMAHPDDDAIFFPACLEEITKPEYGNRVRYLCLSTGDVDGLGEARREELFQSGRVYGVAESDVRVIDDPRLRDGTDWDQEDVIDVVGYELDSEEMRGKADVIITFDRHGVTGHQNHKSLLPAIVDFLEEQPGRTVKLYALRTFSSWGEWFRLLAQEAKPRWGRRGKEVADERERTRTCLNNGAQIRRARLAANKHVSQQKKPFSKRWRLMNVSRYFVVNVVDEVATRHVSGFEL